MGISPRPFEFLIAISVLKNDTTILLFDTKNEFNVFSVSKIDTEKTQKRRKKTWNNALFVKQKYKTTSRYVPYATRVWHRLLQHSRYFIKSRFHPGILRVDLGILQRKFLALPAWSYHIDQLPPWLINGLHWYIYAYVSMLVEDTASTSFFYSHFKSVKRKVSKQERKVSKGLRTSI